VVARFGSLSAAQPDQTEHAGGAELLVSPLALWKDATFGQLSKFEEGAE
jgi:hypothetical protein